MSWTGRACIDPGGDAPISRLSDKRRVQIKSQGRPSKATSRTRKRWRKKIETGGRTRRGYSRKKQRGTDKGRVLQERMGVNNLTAAEGFFRPNTTWGQSEWMRGRTLLLISTSCRSVSAADSGPSGADFSRIALWAFSARSAAARARIPTSAMSIATTLGERSVKSFSDGMLLKPEVSDCFKMRCSFV
jgi:hypothetical protein